MLVDFDSLNDDAHIWYYQTSRTLNDDEVNETREALEAGLEKWKTHGAPMKASVKILHNRVVLIAADTEFQDASGCSMDSLTRTFKKIGSKLNYDFFDRSIGYFEDDELNFFSIFEAKKQVENGVIKPDTPVLNQQLSSMGELKEKFTVKASDTFLNKYFQTTEA